MKSILRLFTISLTIPFFLIIYNCNELEPIDPAKVSQHRPLHSRGVYFSVRGLMCENCLNTIQNNLINQPGVLTVEPTLTPKRNVKIVYDPKLISIKQLEKVIVDQGHEIDEFEEFEQP